MNTRTPLLSRVDSLSIACTELAVEAAAAKKRGDLRAHYALLGAHLVMVSAWNVAKIENEKEAAS